MERNDALGLSFDMLDVDILREIASKESLTRGRSDYLMKLAGNLEQAVKDIGVLRAENARLVPVCKQLSDGLSVTNHLKRVAEDERDAAEAALDAQRRANAALQAELDDWKGRAERQYDYNVEIIAREAALQEALKAISLLRVAVLA